MQVGLYNMQHLNWIHIYAKSSFWPVWIQLSSSAMTLLLLAINQSEAAVYIRDHPAEHLECSDYPDLIAFFTTMNSLCRSSVNIERTFYDRCFTVVFCVQSSLCDVNPGRSFIWLPLNPLQRQDYINSVSQTDVLLKWLSGHFRLSVFLLQDQACCGSVLVMGNWNFFFFWKSYIMWTI